MKYDIALIMVPPWETKMPPLGLAYVCEYLKSRNFKPKVLDFNLTLFKDAAEEKRFFWDISNINSTSPNEIANDMVVMFRDEVEKLTDKIASLECDLVGFSVNVSSIAFAAKVATIIKKKSRRKKIIFGGTGCFWEQDRSIISRDDLGSIDAFVIGEGEEPLEAIINNHNNGRNFENIDGVICNKEDFLKPAAPFYTKDIDKLPFPTFREFELDFYKSRLIPMVISRGCIGRCVFCIDHLMCGRYRFRSPQIILEEIKYHISVNKMNNFGFCDLVCNGNLKQLEEFCDLIIQSGININWGDYAVVRKDMTAELLKKMRRAGCAHLCYGLESGCDRTLKKMNKFYDSMDAQRLIRMTYEAGIHVGINIIVGFPGETKEDFEDTLSFIKRNREYIHEITNVSAFVIMRPSRLGSNPEDFEINLPLPKEFGCFYVDKNGVDFNERVRRVRKTVFLTYNSGISNVIVNYYLKPSLRSKSVGLVFCPVSRIDLVPQRLTRLYAYIHREGFVPFAYDFNVKLYQAAPQQAKKLWDVENWHLWGLPGELLKIFDFMEEEISSVADKLASLEANTFCFLIEKENLMFSLKIADVLKRYNPNTAIIFSSPSLNAAAFKRAINPATVDFFILEQEGLMLRSVLDNIFSGSNLCRPGSKVNNMACAAPRIEMVAKESRREYSIDFAKSGLTLSDYSCRQVEWR